MYIRTAVAESERPTTARRWRTFADVVAFTLGVNVWISIVILPAIFVGALHGAVADRRGGAAVRVPAARARAALRGRSCSGCSRPRCSCRSRSTPQIASSHVYGPIRFALVALGVVAYLFGVSFFTTFHEPPQPRSVRGLSSAQAGPAERWQRRERVYWMLTAMSLVIPTVLIAWVNFDDSIADFLGEMYPGRVALMTTALTVGAIVLWLGIYHYAFLGVLRPHRTGDRDLVIALAQARADAKTGKPRTAVLPRRRARARGDGVADPASATSKGDPCAVTSSSPRLALIGGSLFFFKETLDYLARRDYVAALLVMVIGVAVISVGKEMARLALVQRD